MSLPEKPYCPIISRCQALPSQVAQASVNTLAQRVVAFGQSERTGRGRVFGSRDVDDTKGRARPAGGIAAMRHGDTGDRLARGL